MALQEEMEVQGNFLFKYRGVLPIAFLVGGLLVYVYDLYTNQAQQGAILSGNYVYICLLVGLLGLFIRIYAVGHTPANTSGRNTAEQVADTVNTTGIYATVRHPLYLGNFFMWLAVAMLTANVWFTVSFVLLYWVYYERIMFAEEQFLRKKFGERYTSWAARTPAFIPSFGQFKAPAYPFSWKKILKKEKNGVLALFVIFLLFQYIAMYVLTGKVQFAWGFMEIGTMASLVAYLLLKYLKKLTNVLDEEGR